MSIRPNDVSPKFQLKQDSKETKKIIMHFPRNANWREKLKYS